ncbi:MAG: hypothetical protein WCH98_02760 [Verrucomicrobiota bacterium]
MHFKGHPFPKDVLLKQRQRVAPGDYFVRERDATKKARPYQPIVLRGDLDTLHTVLATMTEEHPYFSGILGWEEPLEEVGIDNVRIVFGIVKTHLTAGINPNDYYSFDVLHPKTKGFDGHCIIVRRCLSNGLPFQPYYHFRHGSHFGLLTQVINSAFGFSCPTDPQRKRGIRIPGKLLNTKMAKPYFKIHNEIEGLVKNGEIRNVNDVIEHLIHAGYQIKNTGTGSLTVVDGNRSLRLAGDYYSQRFSSLEKLQELQADEQKRWDNRFDEIPENMMKLRRGYWRKARENLARVYGTTPEDFDQIDPEPPLAIKRLEQQFTHEKPDQPTHEPGTGTTNPDQSQPGVAGFGHPETPSPCQRDKRTGNERRAEDRRDPRRHGKPESIQPGGTGEAKAGAGADQIANPLLQAIFRVFKTGIEAIRKARHLIHLPSQWLKRFQLVPETVQQFRKSRKTKIKTKHYQLPASIAAARLRQKTLGRSMCERDKKHFRFLRNQIKLCRVIPYLPGFSMENILRTIRGSNAWLAIIDTEQQAHKMEANRTETEMGPKRRSNGQFTIIAAKPTPHRRVTNSSEPQME